MMISVSGAIQIMPDPANPTGEAYRWLCPLCPMIGTWKWTRSQAHIGKAVHAAWHRRRKEAERPHSCPSCRCESENAKGRVSPALPTLAHTDHPPRRVAD